VTYKSSKGGLRAAGRMLTGGNEDEFNGLMDEAFTHYPTDDYYRC